MFGEDAEKRKEMLAGPTAGHVIPRPGTADEVASGMNGASLSRSSHF
jgi:hypothetical protein